MESVITVQIAPTFSSKRRIASGLALFLLRAIKLRSTRWMKALVSALLPDSSFMSVHIHQTASKIVQAPPSFPSLLCRRLTPFLLDWAP
jgi:hypothetical protein